MPHAYTSIAFTPRVRAEQARHGSRASYARLEADPEPRHARLGAAEAAFIAARDSVCMATVGETGWPYVQHRGGPAGFVRVLDEATIGFADFRGNRQYVSVGNLLGDDRVSLIFLDHASRRRLKLFGRARIVGPDDAAMLARLEVADYRATVERGMLITVEGFDWNCPQHIPERFSRAEVQAITAPLLARIAALEAALAPDSTPPGTTATP